MHISNGSTFEIAQHITAVLPALLLSAEWMKALGTRNSRGTRAESHRSPRYILVLSAQQKQRKKNRLPVAGFSTYYSQWVAVDTSTIRSHNQAGSNVFVAVQFLWQRVCFALVIFKDLIFKCLGHRQGSHSIPALNVPYMHRSRCRWQRCGTKPSVESNTCHV